MCKMYWHVLLNVYLDGHFIPVSAGSVFVGLCKMNRCSVPTRNRQLLCTRFLLQKGRQNVTLHLGITVIVCVIIALLGIYNMYD
jgi:hypothetical protein